MIASVILELWIKTYHVYPQYTSKPADEVHFCTVIRRLLVGLMLRTVTIA